ncbi:hypothetical protein BDP27DRAFT_1263940 [Rhodocollybia butyracea]|uniref:F-box domain-containing protein n=1 Tax=Rhodocollybia butyracea TaxID=206335 RepID=A0A9P5PQG0_9AGAR|nr:hypothetical protein BDP27DRAFT_1263940 [Rhodocollybia butyracea]
MEKKPPCKRVKIGAEKKGTNTKAGGSNGEDEEETQLVQERKERSSGVNKKQRVPLQFRNVRGRLGLLERLVKDMPLDVVFEIFSHLGPRDLLHLARTSKDLRAMLITKKAEGIWRAARKTIVGLPPLPSDLNEPEYARLMFDPYCHACKVPKGRCENIFWEFRMRLCKKCEAKLPEYNEEYLSQQPREFRYPQVLPSVYVEVSRKGAYGGYVKRLGSNRCAEILRDGFNALEDEEERRKWLSRKVEEVQAVRAHAKLCEAWHTGQLRERSDELNDIRSQRISDIMRRLTEIGWGEEVETLLSRGGYEWDEFEHHKLVRQSKKLTDYGWNGIKDELWNSIRMQEAASYEGVTCQHRASNESEFPASSWVRDGDENTG